LALTSGSRVGVYEVTAPIGEGGMGQVYRARDTKLNRDVALKILPDAFATDPGRLARFTREAQMLASLNHSNIGAIYGIEESGDIRALVMELVEGEDLSQRIARGAIPLDETLPIARQIADALEAAHERGIIHRDLKPANIKVRPDGTVKVLDFGLAKAMEPASSVGPQASAAMNSPTLSRHATQAGIILGTAAYMSPEQATGKPVDRRSDLWALGVVVIEMLTGRPVFAGETVSHVLASVLTSNPDWTALPAGTPPAIRRMLRRCLEKDRRRRLESAADARLDIEEALAAPIGEARARSAGSPEAFWRRALPWAIAGALAFGLTFVLAWFAPWRRLPAPTAMRLSAELGADASLIPGIGPAGAAAVLSPDGTLLSFAAQKNGAGGSQLYVRRLDQLKATLLPGTDDASSPFFSPDGRWIAFFAGGKLKKISVTGGAAVTVCDAANSRGGAWSDDDSIVLQPTGSGRTGLMRVSSAGGRPEPLVDLADGEATPRWPQMLPGGRAILYTSSGQGGNYADASIVLQQLPNGPRKVLVRGGYFGRYLSSGHLVYFHDGTLFAAPLDLGRRELTRPPTPVVEDVAGAVGNGSAQFAVSDNGTLVYVPGRTAGTDAPIVWLDKTGKQTPIRSTLADWSNLQFSPDGQRLALEISDGRQTDIWLYDWTRDALTRLTLESGEHRVPVWTPDGGRITFRWNQRPGDPANLYWRRADGSGEAQRLSVGINLQQPGAWHPSGKMLVFVEAPPNTGLLDLMLLSVDGDEASGWKPGKPEAFPNALASAPAFSPDGRWIAYMSNASGRSEVYVRPFPGAIGEWQISTDGGTFPVWSRARKELLYAGSDNRIMVVSYDVRGDSFAADKPHVWADARFAPRARGLGGFGGRPFDLHPDGDRVAIAPARETQGPARPDMLVFIFNFFDELRRIAPVTR
jgi:serine/threonine-protein kinase